MLDQLYHSLNPVAFEIGTFSVRWYGLAYAFGFLCASIVMYRVAKRWRLCLTVDDIMSVMVGIGFGVILGGRLAYVIFYGGQYYLAHPLEVFATNQGGMSFHGGLVGALLGGALACKFCRLNMWTMADLGVIGTPIGLFFGRIANFINGELWGKPTDVAWAVTFESGGLVPRHPSQLYEALLEGLLIFIVLYTLSKKSPPLPQKTFLSLFLLFYGCARFLVEFVRVPDEQLGYLWGWLTMGQLLSVPLIIIGTWMLFKALKNPQPQTLERK